MWYVYNIEDTWEQGIAVETEEEAIAICKQNYEELLVYRYVDCQCQ